MKDKILLFAIGVLVGAVIATGAFFVYSKATACKTSNTQQQIPPSMQNGQNNQNGQPPSMPSGENSQNEQPPEMPNNNNNTQNSN